MAFCICTYARAASSTCGLKILYSVDHSRRETAGLSKKRMHFWNQRSGNKISRSLVPNHQTRLSPPEKLQFVAIQPRCPIEKTTCSARLAPETLGCTAGPLHKYRTMPRHHQIGPHIGCGAAAVIGQLPQPVAKLGNFVCTYRVGNGEGLPNMHTCVGLPSSLKAPGAPARQLNTGKSSGFWGNLALNFPPGPVVSMFPVPGSKTVGRSCHPTESPSPRLSDPGVRSKKPLCRPIWRPTSWGARPGK